MEREGRPRRWLHADYPVAKGLKHSTRTSYESIVRKHVIPHLGDLPIADLDVALLDRYVSDRLEQGLAPATVNRQLNVLSLIVRAARKRKLMRDNPVELVDRPRERRRRWRILTPAEVNRVQTAFAHLADDTDDTDDTEDTDQRVWIEQANVVFVVVCGVGLRLGELLGLRWRHVRLADPEGPTLRVEETFVRNRVDTPKSVASTRTLALGPVVAELLFSHRARSTYDTDEDRVFCHPQTGEPLDNRRYAETFRAALTRAGVEGEIRPFHDAGHGDLGTTQRYIDLAGVLFRDEAEAAEARMFGSPNGAFSTECPGATEENG